MLSDHEAIQQLLAKYCLITDRGGEWRFVEKEIQIWRSMLEEG